MSDMPVIDESNSNYVKLPYTLTKGVTATREGLVIRKWQERTWRDLGFSGARLECLERDDIGCIDTAIILSWPDAAERLRYREGEPWCRVVRLGVSDAFENGMYEGLKWLGSDEVFLHRIAAVMCDDAEAFRVLHWCVTEMGGNR